MLRINVSPKDADGPCLNLEGGLAGPWVPELKTAVMALAPETAGLRLNLAQVHFVDAEGLALLRELRERGATLTSVSPFVHELLNGGRP